MFVITYAVMLAYFALAAISPQVTTVPDTPNEWERIAVILGTALFGYWWGRQVTLARARALLVRVLREGSTSRGE